jgi:hypothetical protein
MSQNIFSRIYQILSVLLVQASFSLLLNGFRNIYPLPSASIMNVGEGVLGELSAAADLRKQHKQGSIVLQRFIVADCCQVSFYKINLVAVDNCHHFIQTETPVFCT